MLLFHLDSDALSLAGYYQVNLFGFFHTIFAFIFSTYTFFHVCIFMHATMDFPCSFFRLNISLLK